MQLASARNEETYKIAYKQAEKDFENAQKQVAALEEEVVKALTGDSQLDLSIANQMLLKHRAKLESAQKAMDEAKVKLEAEQETAYKTTPQPPSVPPALPSSLFLFMPRLCKTD